MCPCNPVVLFPISSSLISLYLSSSIIISPYPSWMSPWGLWACILLTLQGLQHWDTCYKLNSSPVWPPHPLVTVCVLLLDLVIALAKSYLVLVFSVEDTPLQAYSLSQQPSLRAFSQLSIVTSFLHWSQPIFSLVRSENLFWHTGLKACDPIVSAPVAGFKIPVICVWLLIWAMKKTMMGTSSSSSLSDTLLSPTDSSILCLLSLFSLLILTLPCSVLSTICLNSSILRLPCPWDINTCGIVGFIGGKTGCSQSGGGHFPVVPLGMLIVRAIKRGYWRKFHEDKMDCNMVAKKERECLHNHSLSHLCSCICDLSAHTSCKCSTCTFIVETSAKAPY